jgi:hypothetical protein
MVPRGTIDSPRAVAGFHHGEGSMRTGIARGPLVLVAAAVLSAAPCYTAHAAQRAAVGSRATEDQLFYQNFSGGFAADEWTTLSATTPTGTLADGDGVVTTSASGLSVVPTGTNPVTGQPAFAATTGQQSAGGGGSDADHVKWLAFAKHTASSGLPGYDIPATGSLTCSTKMSAQVTGLAQQPYGAAVPDPQADPRLGSGTLVAADFQTGAIADFALTNTTVYALYERIRDTGTTYAAYSYAVPVATRTPTTQEQVAIRFDEAGSRVTWLLNGEQVLSIDKIGTLALPRTDMLLDHGGTPAQVSLAQADCGLGIGDELDATTPAGETANGAGLVQLDSTAGFYFDPRAGQPTPQTFLDTDDTVAERLWGQGVDLQDAWFSVTTCD